MGYDAPKINWTASLTKSTSTAAVPEFKELNKALRVGAMHDRSLLRAGAKGKIETKPKNKTPTRSKAPGTMKMATRR